jgi:hypothetical protein
VFPKILTRDERKKTGPETKTKIQQEEEKLLKRKQEMETAKEARISQKALQDKTKKANLGGGRSMGNANQDEKDRREQQKEVEEQAKYDRDF